MNIVDKFNGLNGVVPRAELLRLKREAEQQEQHIISRRIERVLKMNQKEKFFDIEIQEKAFEQVPLSFCSHLEHIQESDDKGLGKAVSPSEIYELITNKLIDFIKKASGKEYVKAWNAKKYGTGYLVPFNFVSKKPYRGVNHFMLTDFVEPLKNPFFLTFKQVESLGGKIIKGATGKEVVYFTKLYRDDQNKFATYQLPKFIDHLIKIGITSKSDQDAFVRQNTIPILKYYNVFNGADIEGIDFKLDEFKTGYINEPLPVTETWDFADGVYEYYPAPKPPIVHGGDRAFYSSNLLVLKGEKVQMPHVADFKTLQDYYRTFFHELGHSTGHAKRLNRDLTGKFGSKKYAFEELVAELTAVFTSAWVGIIWHDNKNHAQYIKNWNKVLTHIEDDTKFVMRAATLAQKATDFMLQFDDEGVPLFIKNYKPKKMEVEKVKTATKPKKIAKPKPKTNAPKTTKPTVEAIKNAPKNTKVVRPVSPKFPGKTTNTDVVNLPINTIHTDTRRFQNRDKLNEDKLKYIIENYNPTIMDPLIVWIDPKDKKTYLLAGHHRLEASKRVGKKQIAAKYYNGNESEAIRYARVESNANRTLETPQERAKIYREMRMQGDSKASVLAEAQKIEGANAKYIINVSYLNPNGMIIQALNSINEATDKTTAKTLEKVADWAGEARQRFNVLTNQHEKEIYDFLTDKISDRIRTKQEFLQKISATVSTLDFTEDTPLNLKRFKYKSEGESMYDQEYNDLKTKIDETLNKKAELRERIKNPKHPQYVPPTASDYDVVLKVLNEQEDKLNAEVKVLSAKLVELQRNKGNYVNAGSNQAALFGAKKTKSKPKPKGLKAPGVMGIGQDDSAPSQFFNVGGQEGEFLQQVERKPKESVVITMDGEQGAGKTTTLYKFMNAFASQGNACLFLSLEEHTSSALFKDKVKKYLTPQAKENIDATSEVCSVDDFYKKVMPYEVIFIDSWQKLLRMVGNIRLDEDIRKKFDGKVFVVIFQQTTTGRTKGGAEVVFDGDMIMKMVKTESFANNYAYWDKNRYTKEPIESYKYMIADGKFIRENEINEVNIEAEPLDFSFEFE